jgi:hypothetical protein
MLSDDEWAQIAGDIMNRTGLAPRGQDDDAVRWVAVRHGADHIHIVATLARQDGGKPRLSNERYRVREACRAAENLHAVRVGRAARTPGPHPRTRTAASMADLDFPFPPAMPRPGPPQPGEVIHPARRSAPAPRPRSPTR